MPLPGFTAIEDATASSSPASFLGVIVSINEQRKTRGTDWVLEFTIQDDFSSGSIGSSSCINCRLFQRNPNDFPKISGIGDVALVRTVKLEAFNFKVACVVSTAARSGVIIFHAKHIPVPELSQAYQLGNQKIPYTYIAGSQPPSTQEQMAVIRLRHTAAALMPQVKQHAATAPTSTAATDKLCLIKDFQFNRFYEVRAQVVNIYYNNFGSVDLKVTDYTSHPELFLYVEPDDEDGRYQDVNWKGPYGQLTLDVKLYGNNCAWARDNVTNGDFVFLKNLHTKESPYNKLEGVLHEDRQRPDQVDIRKLIGKSDIEEINKRREEYESRRTKKNAFDELQNVPTKPPTKAKRAEKRERQRLQKEQEQKEIAKKAEQWEVARSGINANIRASHPEIHLSTISEIIYNPRLNAQTLKHNDFKLAFLNCKHRTRVRVVDFFPPSLELFAHRTSDPSWDKRKKRPDAGHRQGKDRWEWGFVLLLEDAKIPASTVSEKLRVVVSNDAGQHLLDMNARDLKQDTQTLKQLEEKLFILWGNLLELKTDLRDRGTDMPLPLGDNRLQNKPFDCCIEEYGHEVRIDDRNPEGYQRMHKLAGTKIMADL